MTGATGLDWGAPLLAVTVVWGVTAFGVLVTMHGRGASEAERSPAGRAGEVTSFVATTRGHANAVR